jgi:hypothetical protein
VLLDVADKLLEVVSVLGLAVPRIVVQPKVDDCDVAVERRLRRRQRREDRIHYLGAPVYSYLRAAAHSRQFLFRSGPAFVVDRCLHASAAGSAHQRLKTSYPPALTQGGGMEKWHHGVATCPCMRTGLPELKPNGHSRPI